MKLATHVMHLCQLNVESEFRNGIASPTLLALLHLLASKKAFNNVFLRHHLFSILQIVAGRLGFSIIIISYIFIIFNVTW